jgi:4-hydroxy-tetrahydrodipicolinate synthase
MVALVTPMNSDGEVDFDSLQSLIEWHIAEGTNAIVAVGTTGESATLDEKEHCEVIRQVVQMVNGRIPVIAGTGANSTTEAISLTRCASQVGADAALLVTPYYNKPTQQGLYLHFKAVAEAVDLPQILYNVPGRTACDMLPATVGRLAEISNIVGIKEATGELDRLPQIRSLCGDGFDIFSGDDATGCEFMLEGGNGVISVTNNIEPAAMRRMCDHALAGERDEAESINTRLGGLHERLFLEANPIPVKWALYEMGKIGDGIRLPLTRLSEEFRLPLKQAMEQAQE